MNNAEVIQTVTDFSRSIVEERLRQLGQIWPGFDGAPQALELLSHLWEHGLSGTMQPQEWLRMARYGAGLTPNDDPIDIRDICQSLADWLFALPAHSAYEIPAEWAETPMGALWWAALIRAEGDELITLSEAATLSGVSIQAISQRVVRRTLRAYVDPSARNPQKGRTLVRRSDVLLQNGGDEGAPRAVP